MENGKENIKFGLTSTEAENRLRQFGENAVYGKKRLSPFIALIKKFNSPLLLILIVVSLVSFFIGERTNALIILFMLFISALLDFTNTFRSEKAIKQLTDKVASKVTVLRDGTDKNIEFKKVVPGDIVLLSAGDIVPADCQLLETNYFFINQSALTGESFPLEKSAKKRSENEKLEALERNDLVFMGSSVVTGYATALVVSTGKKTQYGKIVKKLSETAEESDFEIGMKNFGYFLMKITILMVCFVFLANHLVSHRGVLESFTFAIAIAIGLTPELLPVILSVALSKGSLEMAKKDVIVKHLPAIQNFGSMNILCTDKTGTLTEDRIIVVKYIDIDGDTRESIFINSYLNSIFSTCIDNPMDNAIKKHRILDVEGYLKIDEIPFDFTRKRNSMVVEKNGNRALITKGAPEKIFEICKYFENEKGIKELNGETLARIKNKFNELSDDGYRVLAIATKEVPTNRSVYSKNDEKDLTFIGFIAFLDPPKESVYEAIDELKKLGVEVKILTGDSEILTKKICREIQLVVKGVVVGHELSQLNEHEFNLMVKKTTIFARITPEQKEKIINALKKMGNVVGFLGDGINDAPALRAADVGISVSNAVVVAKETADIILTKKSLKVLKDGITEGRKTFRNSLKYIMMGLSSNFGNMFSMMGASLFLPFFPMMPSQILLNDFIYDISQLSLPTDSVDEDELKKPPQWNLKFLQKFMLTFGPISSVFDFLTFALLYYVFHLNERQFQTGWFIESIATQIFVIYIIRTKEIPFLQSLPSKLLAITTFFAVLFAWSIPYLPFGKIFSFEPLPASIVLMISGYVVVYLFLVEIVKRLFYKKILSN